MSNTSAATDAHEDSGPSHTQAPSTSHVSYQSACSEPLSAQDSAADKMGWMQGSPVPADKHIRLADGSFFRFPALRYSVSHMSEFVPTTLVNRRNTAATPLPQALDACLDQLTFVPWDSQTPISWEESLWQTYTDGIIVLQRGQVLYERYLGGFKPWDRHALMSVTKSVVGTLALDLVHQGRIAPDQPIEHYLPELADSGFAGATVDQVLNMSTAIHFSEDYANPDAEIWAFSAAGNPLPKPPGYEGPVGYLDYLPKIRNAGHHGERFGYRTVNTEVIGWLVARVTGQSVSDYLEEKVWGRMGMEQDALFQIDERGTPFAGGGLNTCLRDLARFGEMIRNRGVCNGEQILHPATVPDIMAGSALPAFESATQEYLKPWSYRSMWWVTGDQNGSYMARGVHGQNIFIDPANELVVARFASHPKAANAYNDPVTLPAYRALCELLSNRT